MSTNNSIADLRENYSKAQLDRTALASDPIVQFKAWFDDAVQSKIVEPNAMTISTVSADGIPSSRVVLLKEITETGIVFYTNYQSDKAHDIAKNPNIAVNFLWKEIERQVRIQGVAAKISRARSEAYYHSRPKGSQIGAWASPQSKVIKDRSILEEKQGALNAQYQEAERLPIPSHWGGYEITINMIEFWQGRPSRLHDRFRYRKDGEEWVIERVAP